MQCGARLVGRGTERKSSTPEELYTQSLPVLYTMRTLFM